MSRNQIVWFERDLLKSEAFRSLRSPASILVYCDFKMRCKVAKVPIRDMKRKKCWTIINNGELVYPYSEAEKKGIKRARFARVIDELVEKGLIDITHLGSGGKKGDMSKYAISDRWRNYGTEDFVKKERPKDTRQGRGYAVMWKRKRAAGKRKAIIPLKKKKLAKVIPLKPQKWVSRTILEPVSATILHK